MPENNISRRTLTKSAAWSVPVVAVAVAAPMAAASTGVDIIVSRSCRLVSALNTLPRFTVSAAAGDIPAGTTLTLTGAQLANVTVGSSSATVGVLNGNTQTITIGAATPSVTIDFTGVLGVFALSSFTLALLSVPTGYVDSNATNNSASVNVTGVAATFPLSGFLGLCA